MEEFPKYEINDLGHVRNIKTLVGKYVFVGKSGYRVVQFKKECKTYTVKVHRLVAMCFLPEPEDSLVDECAINYPYVVCVNHIDHNKLNNKSNNLEWCTLAHNNKESWRVGNTPALKGEANGMSILTEERVHEICKSFEEGMMPSMAVKTYKISRSQATKIRAGHAWVHVSSQYNIQVNKRK